MHYLRLSTKLVTIRLIMYIDHICNVSKHFFYVKHSQCIVIWLDLTGNRLSTPFKSLICKTDFDFNKRHLLQQATYIGTNGCSGAGREFVRVEGHVWTEVSWVR